MRTIILSLTAFVALLYSCNKDKNTDPSLTTDIVKPLSASKCYAKAAVSAKGSYSILDYGFIFSYSNSYPSLDNGTKISLGKVIVTDTFSTTFSINNNTFSSATYYVRAYISNTKGTVYSSALSFQPLTLSVLSVFPITGKKGDSITITGNNFSSTPDENIVNFNTTRAKVINATTTKLIVEVPDGISSNFYDPYISIYVGAGNQTINAGSFTLTTIITSFSPKTGTFNTTVTLTGENLNGVSLKCNETIAYAYSNSNTSVSFSIPYTIKSEKVKFKVIKNNIETTVNGEFSMNPLSITSIEPKKGIIGTIFSVSGVNFNPSYDKSFLRIGGIQVTSIYSLSASNISGTLPILSAGTYDVEVNNGISSSVIPKAFTVVVPKVSSFSPKSCTSGSEITILGTDLNYNVNVMICKGTVNCSYANIVSQDSSKIIVTIPFGITPGKFNLRVISSSDQNNFSDDFTLEPLATTITDFSPDSGTPGTSVTINGSGFVQGYTEVKFGTVLTTILSISPTEIRAQVPSNAGSGAMKISVVTSGNTVVSDSNFTIL